MTTVWKKILDTSYEVSDKGEVKNASGKILKYEIGRASCRERV